MSQVLYLNPGKREQSKAANRQAILDAARAVFGEMGFEGASVRDIIRRTDLSVGAFYNYFRSKEEVFDALTDDGARRFRPILTALAAEASDVESYLRAAVRAFFDFMAGEQEAWLTERPGGPMPHTRNTPEILSVYDEVRGVIAQVMGRDLSARIDIDYLSSAAIAVTREVGDVMMTRTPRDIDGATEFVVRFIMGGLPALPRRED